VAKANRKGGGKCGCGAAGPLLRGLCRQCFKKALRAGQVADPSPPRVTAGPLPKGRTPKHPTVHEPGTRGKVEEMRSRVARGEGCFHLDDARKGQQHEFRRLTQAEDDEDDGD
jgi:hypothetical protein